jgi:hypothetical protein
MIIVARVRRNQRRVNPDTLKEYGDGEKMAAMAARIDRRATQATGRDNAGKSGFILGSGRKKIVKERAAFYNHVFTP